MNKTETDLVRSSTLYANETLKVIYTGSAGNFPKGIEIEAKPRMVKHSNLPYPLPKWMPCNYYITDLDGDSFKVADERYGELHIGFEWVK